jgi:chromosome segregation ATPase
MKASPKKSRPATASPQKSPTKAAAAAENDQLHEEIKQLQFTVGDRDVEIERMKTTLIALNHKLASLTDVQKEIDDHKSFLKESEGERGALQTHIVQTSQKITIDTSAHNTKHDKSLAEIESLRRDIQELKQQMYQRENDHLKAVEKLNQEHFAECAQKDEY